MLETLRLMLSENWEWRRQIGNLALMDIRKTVRGAALGWVWLFVKPLMYIGVFWFALELGLRAGDSVGDCPYILWLVAGLVPWFFMQNMLGAGANVYKRYPFLVNRIRFPLSTISTFYVLSQFLINLILMAAVFLVCVLTHTNVSVYMLQLPVVYALMLLFWTLFSILFSPLCALSKDFNNLLKALSTPIFWVSGIIFNVSTLDIPVVQTVLAFNPVTFFATASRASLCDQYWIWERPELLIPFVVVFVITLVLAVLCYHRLRKDVADVL